jgi:hypothetical protein
VKISFLVLLACGLLMVSFIGGRENRDRKGSDLINTSLKYGQLSDVRGCLFASDSQAMRVIRDINPKDVRNLIWRLEQCERFLVTLGNDEQDEEVGSVLGEARLFYDGYIETLNEIIVSQIKLNALYANAQDATLEQRQRIEIELERLVIQQENQIKESKKFIERLELLIVRAW